MTWSTITGAGTTTATKFSGDVMNKINNMLNGTDVSDTVTINSAVTWTFKGSALNVRDLDDTHTYTISGGNITGNKTILLPVVSTTPDTFVTELVSQLLKNKRLEDSTTTIVDESDNTKVGKFQVSGITTGNTRTLTWPDFDGTIATLSGTEVFANKTLTSAILTTPRIANAGYIADANGNELVIFTTTASAVNELTYANAATGNNPTISVTGSDTNIGLKFIPKGTGEIFGTMETMMIPLGTETATYADATTYFTMYAPFAFTIVGVYQCSTVAPTTAAITFDIDKGGTTIFSTRPTIAAGAFTGSNGVLTTSPTTVAQGDKLEFQVHTKDTGTTCAGAKLFVRFYRTA